MTFQFRKEENYLELVLVNVKNVALGQSCVLAKTTDEKELPLICLDILSCSVLFKKKKKKKMKIQSH